MTKIIDISTHIQTSMTARFASLNDSSLLNENLPNYVNHIEDNLIDGITLADFEEDLTQGAGGELIPENDSPPKFCATFSSSTLCVNCFAPFRNHPEQLELLGQKDFTLARFEQKMPTGLKGTPPHLDFYAENKASVIAIESKFTEILTSKSAVFKPAYENAFENLAEPSWQEMYIQLKSNPEKYKHLDAAQLCKHYLGLRHNFQGEQQEIILFYIFWEPENAIDFATYSIHRDEINNFYECVSNSKN